MFFKQYYLDCLAHASYMVGDPVSGDAAVVDPQRDVGQYLEDAAANGLRIRYVVLTHFHADFVAGHLELRDRVGAEVCLGAPASAEFTFTPLGDGDSISMGSVRLEALLTPGHTPEAISLLLYRNGDDRPHAVLTGDTLFIGDVGRPDLMASIGVSAGELAGQLYESINDKLMKLPDETLVYPAHGAGSMCGKSLGTERVSTIGEQRRFNYAAQPMPRERFIEMVTADQPEAPEYFLHDAMMNRREHVGLEENLQRVLEELSLDESLAMVEEGAILLDVRDPLEYEGAHLVGSLNIGLGGQYATWAGTLIDKETPIVIVAEPGAEREAAMRLGRIGFDSVRGYLAGGMLSVNDRPELVARTERVTARALAERREQMAVLDVRRESEHASGRIEGSLNVPLNQLDARIAEIEGFSRGKTLVVHCASGYRSSIAASLLERRGVTGLMDLSGGFQAWEASKDVA